MHGILLFILSMNYKSHFLQIFGLWPSSGIEHFIQLGGIQLCFKEESGVDQHYKVLCSGIRPLAKNLKIE